MYFFADRSFVENVCKSDIECAIFVTSELRRWDFRLVPTERSLEAVGKSVPLHIIGRRKVFDLFLRTLKSKDRCVLSQKHALINSCERPLKSDINLEQSNHVETVVLLSKGEIDSKKVCVEFSLEGVDMSGFQNDATYGQIKERVLEQTGLKVSSLYIAQIKQKYGIIERENYNKPKSENGRLPKCPPEKEAAITEALKYFGMI